MEELNRAVFDEDLDEVNRILKAGGNLDLVDSIGKTALLCAVEQENSRLIELLLFHGASINVAGVNGWAPLHMAVDISIDGTVQSNGEYGTEPTAIIGLLIDNGADMAQVTEEGYTPIDIAKSYGSSKIIQYLENAKL
jgi:ankyrin repeat protein